MKINENQTNLSYISRRLQGYFNAKKAEFLSALKQRGSFIECCEKRGFVYSLEMVAYNQQIALVIGLKNGEITIHDLRQYKQKQAV